MQTLSASVVVFWLLACLGADACAEVVRHIRVDSDPSGASVYLLRGTQRIPLGKTPLDYRAEFHSEQSILRLLLEYPGHEPKRIELQARQSRIVARLVTRSFVLGPEAYTDANLRSLQQQISPSVNRVLVSVSKSGNGWTFEPGKAMLRRASGKAWLVIPLQVVPPQAGLLPANHPSQAAKYLWGAGASSIANQIAQASSSWKEVGGVILDVRYAQSRQVIDVGRRVEERTERRCVSGNPTLRRDYLGRPTGQLDFNFCASTAPVTVSVTKFRATETIQEGGLRVIYLLAAGTTNRSDMSWAAVIVSDLQGTSLWRQGTMAPGLIK